MTELYIPLTQRTISALHLTQRTRMSGFQTGRWRCCQHPGSLPLWWLWCPQTPGPGGGTNLWPWASGQRCRETEVKRKIKPCNEGLKKENNSVIKVRLCWVFLNFQALFSNHSELHSSVPPSWWQCAAKLVASVPERLFHVSHTRYRFVSDWSFLKTVWKELVFSAGGC